MRFTAELEEWITEAARQAGVPRELLHGLVQVESGGNPNAVSPDGGAVGLTQLRRAAATDVGVDRFDRWDNLRGGALYLARRLAAHEGDVTAGLAAYHDGDGGVDDAGWPARGWLSQLPPEGRVYPGKVLAAAGWRLVGETAIPPTELPSSRDVGGVGALALLVLAGLAALALRG